MADHHQLAHARPDGLHLRLTGRDQAVEEPLEEGVEPDRGQGREVQRLAQPGVLRHYQPAAGIDSPQAQEYYSDVYYQWLESNRRGHFPALRGRTALECIHVCIILHRCS